MSKCHLNLYVDDTNLCSIGKAANGIQTNLSILHDCVLCISGVEIIVLCRQYELCEKQLAC